MKHELPDWEKAYMVKNNIPMPPADNATDAEIVEYHKAVCEYLTNLGFEFDMPHFPHLGKDENEEQESPYKVRGGSINSGLY